MNFKKLIPDPRDIFIFLGLASLGTGLWWLKPWISLTVVGSILLIIGLITSISGNKGE